MDSDRLLSAHQGKRTPGFALAALAIALVFLTNVPGTMALGLAVFCWLCAQPAERRKTAWRIAIGASMLAYGVACFGIPPSSLMTVGGNVAEMHRGFSNSMKHGPIWLLLVFIAVFAAGWLLDRFHRWGRPVRLPARFAILKGE